MQHQVVKNRYLLIAAMLCIAVVLVIKFVLNYVASENSIGGSTIPHENILDPVYNIGE